MTLDEYVESLKGKRIAAIGIGVSNLPLIELLLRSGCDVTVCDPPYAGYSEVPDLSIYDQWPEINTYITMTARAIMCAAECLLC